MKEYRGYNAKLVSKFLFEHNMPWDCRVVETLPNGKANVLANNINIFNPYGIELKNKHFGKYLKLTPFELCGTYDGKSFDLSDEWIEYLAVNDKNYCSYNIEFCNYKLSLIVKKLASANQDKVEEYIYRNHYNRFAELRKKLLKISKEIGTYRNQDNRFEEIRTKLSKISNEKETNLERK